MAYMLSETNIPKPWMLIGATLQVNPLISLARQIVHVDRQERVCQLSGMDERDVGVDPADGAVLNIGCLANLSPQRKKEEKADEKTS